MYSFHPTFKVHRWTGANDYFCISSDSWLAMGGGGGGFAFQIDDELDAGESNPSDTFGSPRLSSNEFFRLAFLFYFFSFFSVLDFLTCVDFDGFVARPAAPQRPVGEALNGPCVALRLCRFIIRLMKPAMSSVLNVFPCDCFDRECWCR